MALDVGRAKRATPGVQVVCFTGAQLAVSAGKAAATLTALFNEATKAQIQQQKAQIEQLSSQYGHAFKRAVGLVACLT